MSKVTRKFQVTLPRAIARAHRIEPGTEIEFESAGESLRVHVARQASVDAGSLEDRLESFDEATQRMDDRRERVLRRLRGTSKGRGWTRDELYGERIGG